MTAPLLFLTMIFFGGFGLRYAMRSWRSRRRREHARLFGAYFHSGFLLRRRSEFPHAVVS